MRAICPMCRRTVEFDEPKSVLKGIVPGTIEHLVPLVVKGACGHTVAPRWLNKPDEYAATAERYVREANRRVPAMASR